MQIRSVTAFLFLFQWARQRHRSRRAGDHEADVLGQQFANAMPDISGGVGTFGGTPSATDAAAPIQMAGHKGVMQFGS